MCSEKAFNIFSYRLKIQSNNGLIDVPFYSVNACTTSLRHLNPFGNCCHIDRFDLIFLMNHFH